MAEFAVFIFEHLGIAAVVLFLGFLADYFSTPALKVTISQWVQSNGNIKFNKSNNRKFLNSFLDGYIHNIYGRSLFSISFFFRSSAVTFIFLAIAITFQLIYRKGAVDQLVAAPDSLVITVGIIAIMLLVNLFIDYISNIQTISLLRMAAASGRVFDTLIVFFADIALTVTVFTLLFPVGLVASLYFSEAVRPPVTLSLTIASDQFVERVKALKLPLLESNPTIKVSGVAFITKGKASSVDRSYVNSVMLVAEEMNNAQMFEEYSYLIASHAKTMRIVKIQDKSAEAELQLGFFNTTMQQLKFFYYSAFSVANVTRDSFILIMELEPFSVRMGDIYSLLGIYYDMSRRYWLVRCATGEIRLMKEVEIKEECNLRSAVAVSNGPDLFWYDRIAITGADHFPVSPFFFTSFTSSILFYTAILVVGFGVGIGRVVGRLFSVTYIETTTKPFAFLGFIFFVFIEGLVLALRAISG